MTVLALPSPVLTCLGGDCKSLVTFKGGPEPPSEFRQLLVPRAEPEPCAERLRVRLQEWLEDQWRVLMDRRVDPLHTRNYSSHPAGL